MQLRSARVATGLLLVALSGSAWADETPVAVLPGWLAGCWVQEQGTRWTEECWTAPRGGIMLGSGRSGQGDRLGSWEVMQIMLDAPNGDGPVVKMGFFGSPEGQRRTLFAWQPGGEGLTFVNPVHDYPQRIRYWREGERLLAEVSLLDGSKPSRWSYRRSGSSE